MTQSKEQTPKRSRGDIEKEVGKMEARMYDIPRYHEIEIELLLDIRDILESMKQQEKDYWETWKQAQEKEKV